MRSPLLIPLLLAILWRVPHAHSWEAETTHAGLTEQSALASHLHKVLETKWGRNKGLLDTLTIPNADALPLYEVLGKLSPSHGYIPNSNGQTSALAWLVAGAVLANIPASHAANHFFDPRTGMGLTNDTSRGLGNLIRRFLVRSFNHSDLNAGGHAAKQWWLAQENPMGYLGFAEQFRKAIYSTSPHGRSRHLAGTLLAAGAMLHVLQDMGSPSHVRNDLAAHQEQIGKTPIDVGSRFEHIAKLAFSRLGVPVSSAPPDLPSLSAHFSNTDGTGLADTIERRFFSRHTLPRATKAKRDTGASEFRDRVNANLRRPEPRAPDTLDLFAARNPEGATWVDDTGTCLARYHHKHSKVYWSIDDPCALEQLEAILPIVGAYGASFLNTLFADDINLDVSDDQVVVMGNAQRYGAGTIRFFADSKDGTRSEYHTASTQGGQAEMARAPAPPPPGTSRISILFDGQDQQGNSLLATASILWPPQS